MKTKLIYLFPYIPYGLKVKFIGSQDWAELSPGKGIYDVQGCDEGLLTTGGYKISLNDYLPILHPIHEAIDEVKTEWSNYHNNLPYDEDVIEYFDSSLIGDICEIDNFIPEFIPYGAMTWLFSKHYDIFSLIDNNLAIDINTLNYKL